MKRSAFTLIELLVVVAIVAILVGLLASGVASGKTSTFEAEVVEKFTDIDGDGDRVYRCRTVKPTGEVDTWVSYYVHDELQVGTVYQFKARGNRLTEAKRMVLQPTPNTAPTTPVTRSTAK